MDEPFVDDAAFRVVSGVPVRYYPGGKEQGSCVDIPCPTNADEGDVLTVVDGAPSWEPPSGGSTTSGPTLDSGYWMKPKSPFLLPNEVPFTTALVERDAADNGFLGRPLVENYWTQSYVVIASGTGSVISGVLLPETTDGQTWSTPFDDDEATYYDPVGTSDPVTGNVVIAWRIDIATADSMSGDAWISTDGDDPTGSPSTLSWWRFPSLYGTQFQCTVPSAINTTSTQTSAPGLYATLGGSTDWEVRVWVRRVAGA